MNGRPFDKLRACPGLDPGANEGMNHKANHFCAYLT